MSIHGNQHFHFRLTQRDVTHLFAALQNFILAPEHKGATQGMAATEAKVRKQYMVREMQLRKQEAKQ